MKGFTNWLINAKGFSPVTSKRYAKYIEKAHKWAKTKGLDVKNATYADILSFVGYLKEVKQPNAVHINQYLVAIGHYLTYANRHNSAYANPAVDLRVKGAAIKTPIDAFTRDELDGLYTSWPITRAASKRNKIIMGLIVFQGIRHREILKLQAKHIDFEKGEIYTPGSLTSNSRILQLQPGQIIPLHEYIKGFENGTDILFTANHMGHFYRQFKRYNPQIEGTYALRGSVYAHWVKNNNLRQAQYMAGHKKVASTQKYKQDDLEDLQNAVDKFHPLK